MDCPWKTYVCQYSPAGNVGNNTEWAKNVLTSTVANPATAAVPKPGRRNSTTPRPPTSAALTKLSADATAALTRHNFYRRRHQVADLIWDDAIAASAAKWVAGCPQGHSGYAGMGENMAWATSKTVKGMVDMWYNEVSCMGYVMYTSIGAGQLGALP